MATHYKRTSATKRPFRLWDTTARKEMRWRYYSDPKRAHLAALLECRWSKPGVTIEVYNATTARLLGQYTRHLHHIDFTGA